MNKTTRRGSSCLVVFGYSIKFHTEILIWFALFLWTAEDDDSFYKHLPQLSLLFSWQLPIGFGKIFILQDVVHDRW